MDRNALAELLQALESRRDAEERRREERYTALIERLLNTLVSKSCQIKFKIEPNFTHQSDRVREQYLGFLQMLQIQHVKKHRYRTVPSPHGSDVPVKKHLYPYRTEPSRVGCASEEAPVPYRTEPSRVGCASEEAPVPVPYRALTGRMCQ
ncbi:UNVERIFIED_CONTAM: hypothetical protein FKN15_005318 [Acipenser sinensis]